MYSRLAGTLSVCTLLLVALVALAPAATAWRLLPAPSTPPAPASFAAWTTDLAPSAFPAVTESVSATIACPLGDITQDGIADILVLARDPATGAKRLSALAGPGFEQVIWEKASTVQQVLRCAPDVDLDGTLDPILASVGETTGTTAGVASDEATRQVQQVLDGASGAVLLGRAATDTATGAATGAAGAGAGAAQEAVSTLLPAAAGATALLQVETTTALLPVPPGVPLPLDALTATVSQSAQLQVLDAAGAVVTTVQVDKAGVEALAMAPLPLAGGLPDIAVLTRTLGPVEEVATGVPELTLYAADGTLSWATQLPATTGIPILVPQAGDLNLDGMGDLVVTTVQEGVAMAPAAAFWVLSGLDGQILFDSGAAVEGLVTALPLGSLPNGPALLSAAAGASGPLVLSALDGAGAVLWSIDVDRLAKPVNAVLDAHSGDITGFTDLTGDAIPDVAVAVASSGGLALQAIDGVTGDVAWNLTLAGVETIVPVAVGLADQASQAVGQAPGAVRDAQASVGQLATGAPAALLALGSSATQATLKLIDPLTGSVVWAATAAVPASAALASLSAQTAGDLDGDGQQDLLVTANFNLSVVAASTGSTGTAQANVQDGGAGTPGSVTAVSGGSGETLYTASDGSASSLEYQTASVPANETSPPQKDEAGIPGPAPALLALALVSAAFLRRRRA